VSEIEIENPLGLITGLTDSRMSSADLYLYLPNELNWPFGAFTSAWICASEFG
jgi:hypothetical protein